MGGGLPGSLPPIASPGRMASALDSANRTYGHQACRPRHVQAYRQPQFAYPLSHEAVQSKQFSDHIMAALCKQAYHGVKQVERQVFLGGDRFGGVLSSASTLPSSLTGAGTSTAVGGGGARVRAPSAGAEAELPVAEDMLDASMPESLISDSLDLTR